MGCQRQISDVRALLYPLRPTVVSLGKVLASWAGSDLPQATAARSVLGLPPAARVISSMVSFSVGRSSR
jgi:hypothetical protein